MLSIPVVDPKCVVLAKRILQWSWLDGIESVGMRVPAPEEHWDGYVRRTSRCCQCEGMELMVAASQTLAL